MHDVFLNQANLFLLGTLEPQEEKQFLQHLAGCAECKKTVAETARVMRALPMAWLSPDDSPIHFIHPPAALKEKLLHNIKSDAPPAAKAATHPQVWKNWSNMKKEIGLVMVRADEGDWEDTGVNGFQVKRLFVDEAHDSVTMLVRGPAGAVYPSHRHAGPEQCYVLTGDLHVGDAVLRAGDYQYASSDSIHGIQYTESGCLLLIVSSLHDEIFAEAES